MEVDMEAMKLRNESLDKIAKTLEEILTDLYGKKMGFALFMFPFNEEGPAGDYVSNGQREDMIKFMRELADRLEAGKDIPKTEGSA
jgi:hypothetical protein